MDNKTFNDMIDSGKAYPEEVWDEKIGIRILEITSTTSCCFGQQL